MKIKNVLYRKQLAGLFSKLLGFTFIANHSVAQQIENICK